MTIEPGAFVRALRRWWWVLLMAPLVGAAFGLALAQVLPPRYLATATVVLMPSRDPGAYVSDDLQAAMRLAATYARLVGAGPVLAAAGAAVVPPASAEDLGKVVSARAVTDLPIVEIAAGASDPQRAADLANAVAAALVTRFLEDDAARVAPVLAWLESTPATATTTTEADIGPASERAAVMDEIAVRLAANDGVVRVWAEATPPTEQVAPRPLLMAILGAVTGALLVMGAVITSLILRSEALIHLSAASIHEVRRPG